MPSHATITAPLATLLPCLPHNPLHLHLHRVLNLPSVVRRLLESLVETDVETLLFLRFGKAMLLQPLQL